MSVPVSNNPHEVSLQSRAGGQAPHNPNNPNNPTKGGQAPLVNARGRASAALYAVTMQYVSRVYVRSMYAVTMQYVRSDNGGGA